MSDPHQDLPLTYSVCNLDAAGRPQPIPDSPRLHDALDQIARAAMRKAATDRVDALPPTQYLVLDVLAARWRLGERTWTFPTRLRPALRALAEDERLIGWKAGVQHDTALAWLTEDGQAVALWSSYQPPADVRVEWAVQYPAGGSPLRQLDEDGARSYLAIARETNPDVVLVRRTVATGAWQRVDVG